MVKLFYKTAILQGLQGEEEQIEAEFKAISKTAQNLVKDSPQPVINTMLAELKQIKDRLLKVNPVYLLWSYL